MSFIPVIKAEYSASLPPVFSVMYAISSMHVFIYLNLASLRQKMSEESTEK